MKRKLFVTAWLVIFAVTTLDVVYTLYHAAYLVEWESNPAMRELMCHCGVFWGIAWRAGTVLFGLFTVLASPARSRFVGTVTILLIHLYLASVFVVGYSQPMA